MDDHLKSQPGTRSPVLLFVLIKQIYKIMINQIIGFLKAWIRGDEAELNIDREWSFTWWEVGAILVIIGLVGYWIWR